MHLYAISERYTHNLIMVLADTEAEALERAGVSANSQVAEGEGSQWVEVYRIGPAVLIANVVPPDAEIRREGERMRSQWREQDGRVHDAEELRAEQVTRAAGYTPLHPADPAHYAAFVASQSEDERAQLELGPRVQDDVTQV